MHQFGICIYIMYYYIHVIIALLSADQINA